MNWRIIRALVVNDYRNFIREKSVGGMAVFGMAVFISFYFIMPSRIDETIEIGVHAPALLSAFGEFPADAGLTVHIMESEEDLRREILDGRYLLGISIDEEVLASMLSGTRPRISIIYSSRLPEEMKEMSTVLIGEMLYGMGGFSLDIDREEIVLGPDMAGRQIPLRKRLLPTLVFMMLVSEIIGLSHLITSEVQKGTIHALLATPMRVVDFFVGKGLTGLSMAFSQIMLLMIVTTSVSRNVSLVLVSLLLGAMMVTGIAFIIASVSRDLMSVIGWGTVVMIVMFIPAFVVLFPGTAAGWIKVIPSYFLVDILHRAINLDIGWGGNARNVGYLTGFNAAFLSIGITVLKRKLT